MEEGEVAGDFGVAESSAEEGWADCVGALPVAGGVRRAAAQ